jgi:hypothetical protein
MYLPVCQAALSGQMVRPMHQGDYGPAAFVSSRQPGRMFTLAIAVGVVGLNIVNKRINDLLLSRIARLRLRAEIEHRECGTPCCSLPGCAPQQRQQRHQSGDLRQCRPGPDQ